MIKFKFKVKDKTIEATVPEGWHEVTLKHVLALESEWTGESKDMIGLLSTFTGQNFQTLENAKGDLWEPIFQVLSFVFDAPKWEKLKRTKIVNIGGKMVRPPKNLSLETLGQKILALNLITNGNDHIKNIPDIISIYLQPAYDTTFVSDRINDIKRLVLDMKAYEAMPYGLFFLKKLLRPRNYGRLGLRVSLKMLRNLQSIQKQGENNSHNLVTS